MYTICPSSGKSCPWFLPEYTVEYCVFGPRNVSTLEILATVNFRSRTLQTELELQSQFVQPEKLTSTNSLFQKDLAKLQQKLDNHCGNAKDATKETMDKLSLKCCAPNDILTAAAPRNKKQEKIINFLKQVLANFILKATKESKTADR